MRRTPASEQYLQAQITLLLHIVYASLLCASIKRSLRLQQALQNRPSRTSSEQRLVSLPASVTQRESAAKWQPLELASLRPGRGWPFTGLARSNVWFHCQLPSLREKALQNGSHLRSRRVSLWLQFGVCHAGNQAFGYCPAHGFFCLPSGLARSSVRSH